MEFDNSNLSETREQLLNEISNLSSKEFNMAPQINQWSISQVCRHLSLTEQLFTKAIVHGLGKEKSNEVERKRIDRILDRSKKVEAPSVSSPADESFEVREVIELLNNSRKELLNVISKIDDISELSQRSVKHLVFGELPLDQWVELVHLHEQRHIGQIKEIKIDNAHNARSEEKQTRN